MYCRQSSDGLIWAAGAHCIPCCPKMNGTMPLLGENVRLYECNNCIVHTPHLKQAVIQGLDGYIIAEKEGTLLICRLAEEQRIKEFSKA